jgi:hypothetical protein
MSSAAPLGEAVPFSYALLLGCGAPLALEAGATALVIAGRGSGGAGLHALAAVLAFGLTALHPQPEAARGNPAVAPSAAAPAPAGSVAAWCAAVLVLTLPVVGAALLAFVAWPSWRRRPESSGAALVEVALPDGSGDIDEPPLARAPEARPIRELLRDATSADERVRAVMALRHMDARRAVPLLKLAFSHPSEDVRLLAFAILERREKRLRAGIRALERRLAQLESRSRPLPCEQTRWRAQCHRRLAQYYWELCYGGFVSGDLEIEALERAARYALAADAEQGDAATALLLARIHLRQRKATEAWHCLERAELAGAHREAAYALRRFDEIPRLLRRMERPELCRPDLAEVAQFWTEPRLT